MSWRRNPSWGMRFGRDREEIKCIKDYMKDEKGCSYFLIGWMREHLADNYEPVENLREASALLKKFFHSKQELERKGSANKKEKSTKRGDSENKSRSKGKKEFDVAKPDKMQVVKWNSLNDRPTVHRNRPIDKKLQKGIDKYKKKQLQSLYMMVEDLSQRIDEEQEPTGYDYLVSHVTGVYKNSCGQRCFALAVVDSGRIISANKANMKSYFPRTYREHLQEVIELNRNN